MTKYPKQIALEFVQRINERDVAKLGEMMTEDHRFIDIAGELWQGRRIMMSNWEEYYRIFPDYTIEIERAIPVGNFVILIGVSDGNLSEHGREVLRRDDGTAPPRDELQGPAVWTAIVDSEKIRQWRVYPDTQEVRERLRIARKS